MKLSIAIPCYNEEKSLDILIGKCKKIISDEIEIILVDNGSVDDTFKILNQFNLPENIKPIRLEINKGYGNGILEGLRNCNGEVLAWTHADLQTDPLDVVKGYYLFQSELLNKECIVKGVRRNRNIFDSFFTFMMGVFSSLVLKKWFFDVNAQPKIFHKSF